MNNTDDVLKQLETGVKELSSSDAWRKYLDMQARFHSYSFGNCLLIALQCPDATRVAGYGAWQKMGRQVRKGEKSLRILAPMTFQRKVELDDGSEEVSHAIRFRDVGVFDVSQTEGDPLPEVPVARLEGEAPEGVYERLVNFAGSIGFRVEDADLAETNGDCTPSLRRIRVAIERSPVQRVKTLAHEIGHALLHSEEVSMPRGLKELEAESVAYIVCANVGVDSSDYVLDMWRRGEKETGRYRASAIPASASRRLRKA